MFATPNRWQQRSLLLVGSEVQQDVRGQVDLVDRAWCAGTQNLFAHDAVVQRVVIAAAAVFDRPVRTDEPGVEQSGKPSAQQRFLFGGLGRSVSLARFDCRCVFGDVCPDPIPEFGQLRLIGSGTESVHQPDTSASSARLDRAVPSR